MGSLFDWEDMKGVPSDSQWNGADVFGPGLKAKKFTSVGDLYISVLAFVLIFLLLDHQTCWTFLRQCLNAVTFACSQTAFAASYVYRFCKEWIPDLFIAFDVILSFSLEWFHKVVQYLATVLSSLKKYISFDQIRVFLNSCFTVLYPFGIKMIKVCNDCFEVCKEKVPHYFSILWHSIDWELIQTGFIQLLKSLKKFVNTIKCLLVRGWNIFCCALVNIRTLLKNGAEQLSIILVSLFAKLSRIDFFKHLQRLITCLSNIFHQHFDIITIKTYLQIGIYYLSNVLKTFYDEVVLDIVGPWLFRVLFLGSLKTFKCISLVIFISLVRIIKYIQFALLKIVSEVMLSLLEVTELILKMELVQNLKRVVVALVQMLLYVCTIFYEADLDKVLSTISRLYQLYKNHKLTTKCLLLVFFVPLIVWELLGAPGILGLIVSVIFPLAMSLSKFHKGSIEFNSTGALVIVTPVLGVVLCYVLWATLPLYVAVVVTEISAAIWGSYRGKRRLLNHLDKAYQEKILSGITILLFVLTLLLVSQIFRSIVFAGLVVFFIVFLIFAFDCYANKTSLRAAAAKLDEVQSEVYRYITNLSLKGEKLSLKELVHSITKGVDVTDLRERIGSKFTFLISVCKEWQIAMHLFLQRVARGKGQLQPLHGWVKVVSGKQDMVLGTAQSYNCAEMRCGHIITQQSMAKLLQDTLEADRDSCMCPHKDGTLASCGDRWPVSVMRHVACYEDHMN